MIERRLDLAEKLVRRARERDYYLTPDALNTIIGDERPEELLEKVLEWVVRAHPQSAFIERRHIDEVLSQMMVKERIDRSDLGVDEEVRMEITSPSYEDLWMEGTVEEFRRYFMNRYQRLRSMLEQRGITFSPISELVERGAREAYIAGIIVEAKKTEKGYRIVIEDPLGRTTLLVRKMDRALERKAELLIPDIVAGFRVMINRGALIVRDIIFPDVPSEVQRRLGGPDINVCIISDIHVGSSKFVEEIFRDFLDWLSSDEVEAKKTKYLLINGDLVDGIYVYPGQEKELNLPSLSSQFKQAAELLAEIPERIKVVYAPGNHEPVRKALPQPILQRRYREIIEERRKVLFVGNPALLRIDGISILMHHGQSFDAIIQASSRFSYSNLKNDVGDMMEFMIKCRHLAPTYGETTMLLPTEEDYLVIFDVPTLLATGHLHVAALKKYKGVTLLNTGTWQDQTSYQKNLGIEPTIGTAAIFNLKDLSLRIMKFC